MSPLRHTSISSAAVVTTGAPEAAAAFAFGYPQILPRVRISYVSFVIELCSDHSTLNTKGKLMNAAIYARKSTEQAGVSDDQKSVARQIDHARQYAARKGWTVADEHVYVDDGISGAELANRPGFLRLMNALKPRAPFQVLIMSEESRLGREHLEVGYSLKQIIQAGVRVFFYLEDRERTLDSPTDKIMLSLATFADELERARGRQRTYDAMQRKARAGHVTGGWTFGYRNVEIVGVDGRRSHVEREIEPAHDLAGDFIWAESSATS